MPNLPGIVEIVVLAERETAVEHDVLFRIERIRIDQHWYVMANVKGLFADKNPLLFVPPNRQFVRDLRQHTVALRIAPENQVRVGDDLIIDLGVVDWLEFAAELL